MLYRTFGNTGLSVSILGFGCMRLPMTMKDGIQVVDDERAVPLLRRAVECGVNFFDSAWFYCNNDSQRAMGAALRPLRDKVYISSKVPLHLIRKAEEFDEYLERALEQMGIAYLDFHHFHGLTYTSWKEKILGLKLLDRAEKAKAKGLIRHLSFSFHGDPDKMPELIDTGAFSSILGQYNLVDRANEEVFAYAKSKGLGTAVMGPLVGGSITDGGSALVERMESGASSAAEMGLRFVWGTPSVDILLSGMHTLEQLEENVTYANRAGSISPEERQALIDRGHVLSALNDLYCTGCQYCNVCPEGINPGKLFQMYIQHTVWGLTNSIARRLSATGLRSPGTFPTACTNCGACAARCPQKIDIPRTLQQIWPELDALREGESRAAGQGTAPHF